MTNRFKMSFDNSSFVSQQPVNNNVHYISKSLPKPVLTARNMFNVPMVDRIHKAKPGCSACGKKVA
jgi:hypothetical protein